VCVRVGKSGVVSVAQITVLTRQVFNNTRISVPHEKHASQRSRTVVAADERVAVLVLQLPVGVLL
jgi:hypothetical protein